MYKVLLVDDERIVRDGIAAMIDWERQGLLLVGTAQNGLEAYEKILNDPPQIIITDIKMPGLDGMGLIARTKEKFPEIIFVILSGFNEFELVEQAMRQGIKYYLLKPCHKAKIVEVLDEVKQELLHAEARERFIKANRENLEKVMPLVKEQFLRDFIMNSSYTRNEFGYYSKLLNIENNVLRLVIFEPEGEFGFEELLGLIKIVQDTFTVQNYFQTIIKNQVLVLWPDLNEDELIDCCRRVKTSFTYYHQRELCAAYSESDRFANLPLLFKQVQNCLKYSMYVGLGGIISPKDTVYNRSYQDYSEFFFDYDPVTVALKSGNTAMTRAEINRFFTELREKHYGIHRNQAYAIDLLMAIVRQYPMEDSEYINQLFELLKLNSLEQMQELLLATGCRLAEYHHEHITVTHNELVQTIIAYVQEHLGEETLSLKLIANRVLYMSSGYLSKLFFKETGQKFSQYLIKLRIKKAKELIMQSNGDRIYEVALKVGFGNNPQYFSQIFKKHTGYVPTEYRIFMTRHSLSGK